MSKKNKKQNAAVETAESAKSNRKAIKAAGVAVGVGSAAIVAALLYANRRKKAGKARDE
ncbi:hypothetical protein [Sphingomicrobium arenosum]|uniref:hypothetical protein n=1 Tax=Sphingomicrobium arenosum TaxID=2233861 RepID=UPI0022407877|nr:hypothetical protein [Sphingomicrobium arenosum]